MNPLSINDFDNRLKKCVIACAKPRLSPTNRDQVSTKLKRLTAEAGALGLSSLADEIGNFFLTRERLRELNQAIVFPTQSFLELGQRGLTGTLQFGISDSPDAFSKVPVEVLLRAVSSPVLFDKIAKKRKGLLSEVLVVLRHQHEQALPSAGFLWAVNKAKIEELFSLLPAIFNHGHRSEALRINSDLRVHFLSRDKTGNGIAEILNYISKGELVAESLVDALRLGPEAAVVFLRILPKLLPKAMGGHALKILEEWLPFLPDTPPSERAMVSGALALLCGSLLQKPRRNPSEETVLRLVTESMKQLALQIGADVCGFWGLFPLGDEFSRGSGGPQISPEGARLLVESLEIFEDDRYKPVEVITALAMNLGLTQINEPGNLVHFDPKQHADAVGGLLRDHPAVVLRAGWRYKDALLLKSRVKPQTDHA